MLTGLLVIGYTLAGYLGIALTFEQRRCLHITGGGCLIYLRLIVNILIVISIAAVLRTVREILRIIIGLLIRAARRVYLGVALAFGHGRRGHITGGYSGIYSRLIINVVVKRDRTVVAVIGRHGLDFVRSGAYLRKICIARHSFSLLSKRIGRSSPRPMCPRL